ncbi:MAG TPA: phosphotransferase family protein [Jatrophihabitans sp.]|nr:phosphotransferase family protein [Jatrophihabitans sp.]
MTDEPQLDGPSLQRFLDDVEPSRGGTVTSFRPISGGYSRLSALADVRWGDGSTACYVLRADPPPDTGVFVSDRDDEWRLLQALAGKARVRTPTPRWYDATGQYFGAKCLIVDFFASTPLAIIAQQPDQLDRAQATFVDAVADLHQTPLDVLPPELDHPADWDSYIDGLVDRLDHLDAHVGDTNPALHYAAAQLRAHRPPPVPLTLVHGDCQPANLLVPETGDVLVIDWEFGRIGDPREDLGYYCHLPVPPNLYEADPAAFLARYRERTGLTVEQVNEDTVDAFVLLGHARLFGQMLEAADALANGRPRGAMATYMLNGISAMTRLFFQTAHRLAG